MSWCINLFCVFSKRRWNKMIWFSCAWTWTGTWLWREIKREKNVELLLYALQKRKMSVKRKGKFGIERPNRMEQYKSARFFTLLLARSLKQRERARESVFSLIWLGWGSICQRAEKKKLYLYLSLSRFCVSAGQLWWSVLLSKVYLSRAKFFFAPFD
jgi:hypothetical protein